jgi:hypothetical protein
MRNIIVFIINLSISLSPLLLMAQLPAGMIASYPLNNSAIDGGSSNYNGTLNSTSAAVNRFGTANSATAFTAGVSTGTLPSGLATAMSNDFSYGYWFNTTMTAPSSGQWYGGAALVDAEVCGGTNDWGTALIDGGKVSMGIGNPDLTIKSAATYNNGAWHFVTATRNMAAGVIILYVDGAQVATTSGTNVAALTAPNLVGLGRNPCNATPVYTGSLDDLVIYNRVLSSVEVSNLYNFYAATVLPLQWESFTGQVKGELVYLKWETENSTNNDRFEIQHSGDGINFSVIGILPDNGGVEPAAGSAVYHFTDMNPAKGNNFYRIRQVDKDGKYSWSSVIELTLRNTFYGLHLRTNPVANEAALVNDDQLLIQRVQITDISGRTLIDQALNSGNSLINIYTQGLAPGYYLMRVITAGNQTTLGLVKR